MSPVDLSFVFTVIKYCQCTIIKQRHPDHFCYSPSNNRSERFIASMRYCMILCFHSPNHLLIHCSYHADRSWQIAMLNVLIPRQNVCVRALHSKQMRRIALKLTVSPMRINEMHINLPWKFAPRLELRCLLLRMLARTVQVQSLESDMGLPWQH